MRKDEEKYEETMTNFEGAYLRDGYADSAEIFLPRGIFHRKIVQFRSDIIDLQMRKNGIYLVPV